MHSAKSLSEVLQRSTEIFMRRSMHSFMLHAKETGVSMGQLSALMRIHHKGTAAVSAIGEDLGITNAAASQMLDRLVQQGYISRSEDPHDRRVRQIEITPKGRQILNAALKARQVWLEELVAALSPAEQNQVQAALELLNERAAQLEPLPAPHH